MKKIALLGATGSVGSQAIDVIRARGYQLEMISANKDVITTEALAREFSPIFVAMADTDAAADLKVRLRDTSVKILSGADGITDAIRALEKCTVEIGRAHV